MGFALSFTLAFALSFAVGLAWLWAQFWAQLWARFWARFWVWFWAWLASGLGSASVGKSGRLAGKWRFRTLTWREKFLEAGKFPVIWKKNLGKILKLFFFAVMSCFGKNCNLNASFYIFLACSNKYQNWPINVM